MEIQQNKESFKSLPLLIRCKSTTSCFKPSTITGECQVTSSKSQKTSFDTSSEDSLISTENSKNVSEGQYQGLQEIHETSSNHRESDIEEIYNPEYDDIDKSENVKQNEMKGKMYLINKLLKNERSKIKTLNMHGDWSDANESFEKKSTWSYKTYSKSSLSIRKNNTNGLNDFYDYQINDSDTSSFLIQGSDLSKNRKQKLINIYENLKSQNQRTKKKTVDKNSSGDKVLPRSPVDLTNDESDKSYKYSKFMVVLNKQQREQQIKDVYAKDTFQDTEKTSGRLRTHKPSSFVNRQNKNKEITRTNSIIVNKILNVRTTIPRPRK